MSRMTFPDVLWEVLRDPSGAGLSDLPRVAAAMRAHTIPPMFVTALRENWELIERWAENPGTVELPDAPRSSIALVEDYLRNRVMQLGALIHAADPGFIFETVWRAWCEHQNAVMFEQFCEEKPQVTSSRAIALLDVMVKLLGLYIPIQAAAQRLPKPA